MTTSKPISSVTTNILLNTEKTHKWGSVKVLQRAVTGCGDACHSSCSSALVTAMTACCIPAPEFNSCQHFCLHNHIHPILTLFFFFPALAIIFKKTHFLSFDRTGLWSDYLTYLARESNALVIFSSGTGAPSGQRIITLIGSHLDPQETSKSLTGEDKTCSRHPCFHLH